MNNLSNSIGLPLLLALAACTISIPGDESGDEPATTSTTGSTDTAAEPSTSSDSSVESTTTADPTTGDSSAAPSSGPASGSSSGATTAAGDGVPPELVGRTWTWVSSAGVQSFTFTAEGEYTSAVYVDGHPGESCGTEYFIDYTGLATFAGSSLTVSPTLSERTKMDSCSDTVVSEEVFEGEVKSYEWRLASEDWCLAALVLKSTDDAEYYYCAE